MTTRPNCGDPKQDEKVAIAGKWLAREGTEWEFRADGTFQITGTRNKGEWKKTAKGIELRYAGATVWIHLQWVGQDLVDQDGYIGHARLKKRGSQ
jgi:predicted chitinase